MRFSHIFLLFGLIVVVTMPYVLRGPQAQSPPGALRLVVISPHGEAIRTEFDVAFLRWHEQRYGRPVLISWRSIGGTSEIAQYLNAQMLASFREYWTRTLGRTWTDEVAAAAQNTRLKRDGASETAWAAREAYLDDDATPLDCGIDVFFGGGPYDHNQQAIIGNLARIGLLTPEQPELPFMPQRFRGEDYYPPPTLGGRPNRAFDRWYGATLSSFGIVYNVDRLRDLGIAAPPRQWSDLCDPAYFRKLGAADPTKSSSITKCFEMIVQQRIWIALRERGIDESNYDAAIQDRPADVNDALAAGWREGLRIIQLIGANARYFTDSSNKVPIDVGQGDAAVGICVDFYGRFQSQFTESPRGVARMVFVNPYDEASGVGGSSINADPVSVLRMADDPQRPYRRDLARRFVEFCLSTEGQKLWTYRAGLPGDLGGPVRYTQRRVAIRRDFYEPSSMGLHRPYLADPDLNPFEGREFLTYREEWTGDYFNALRVIIRCMCMDAGDELRSAWGAVIAAGGPRAAPEAFARLTDLPRFTLATSEGDRTIGLEYGEGLKTMREMLRRDAATRFALTQRLISIFRAQYQEAENMVRPIQNPTSTH